MIEQDFIVVFVLESLENFLKILRYYVEPPAFLRAKYLSGVGGGLLSHARSAPGHRREACTRDAHMRVTLGKRKEGGMILAESRID